jgi:signal transduction histidine kinase
MEPFMVTGRRGVTIRLVLLVGLVATALAYLALRIWTAQGEALPQSSWGALIVLVFMACGVFFAGLPVRRFLRGQAKKPLNPIRAMRTVVLAQASALTGALVTGWYLAQILVLLPDVDVSSRRALLWRLAALAAGGVLMVVAGLAVQGMCRVDEDQGDQDRADGADEREEGSGGSDER